MIMRDMLYPLTPGREEQAFAAGHRSPPDVGGEVGAGLGLEPGQ
eukprot:CAMPEP_0118706074 /NCGR_PEP_ID=MMETSP0800-20121206/20311_1 /TAXON_ID=210618 ORGANISM="Striatella unipunctata, Strain CCMP2910" /NCGR_SAMPLE_ID=MMETSP0800 /ASSEMBLY_ACC=CAM_ASM_000638 /LENGTH=43 /DNA_ID= /DNA_START= /DNA_END= /DNA_ORIENTATION=